MSAPALFNTKSMDGFMVATITFFGPSDDVTLPATSSISVQLLANNSPIKNVVAMLGITSIGTLPDGVIIKRISYNTNEKTVSIVVYNTTTSDITIAKDTLYVEMTVVGY